MHNNKYYILSVFVASLILIGCESDKSKPASTCDGNDNLNTSCGETCMDCTESGKICMDGFCVCPGGYHKCDDTCVIESDYSCGSGCIDCTSTGLVCDINQCRCPDNTFFCDDQCVQESNTNCGIECINCESNGMICENSNCICPDDHHICGDNCVQAGDSSCGNDCIDCTETGMICRNDRCECPDKTVFCDNQCIQESDTVCGSSCENCVEKGLECHRSKCTCPDNMAWCDHECVPATDELCGDTCTDCTKLGLICQDRECVCPNQEVLCDGTCTPQSDTTCGSDCTNCLEIGSVCQNGQCICTPKTLEYTVFENKIDDLELEYPSYSGEIIASNENGQYHTNATNALPYHRFEVKAENTFETELFYRGTTHIGERLALFAYKPESQQWIKLDSDIYLGKDDIKLHAIVPNLDYVSNGVIQVIVAPELKSNNADSILLTGDTQTYVSPTSYINGEPNGIYNLIMEYAKEQYENKKIAYFHHTGDLTANSSGHNEEQFDREFRIASEAHHIIDDAGVPNGISVGNHDNHVVTSHQDNYVRPWYDKYFPYTRYSDNFWYAGHYDNNYHSYTLVTIADRDFVFLNLGYDSYPYEWANKVLKMYSHRIAVVCAHSYLGGESKLTAQGNIIYNNFVAPNKNVLLVLSGHVALVGYNIRTFEHDPNRKIYEIVVDHSLLVPVQGASGYLRWITFKDNQIINTTYSPYLDNWRTASDDPAEEWVADLTLPDTQREIHTLEFSARSKCACNSNDECSDTEVCHKNQCVCRQNMLSCDGQCVEETNNQCGQNCLDCTSANARCQSGMCVCPSGQIAVYDIHGIWTGCTSQCGDSICGVNAICVDSGSSQRCRCGGFDGEVCETGGTCVGHLCDCADDLKLTYDPSVPIGCLVQSEGVSEAPSQITMSIASNAEPTKSAMSFNWLTSPDTVGGELVYSTSKNLVDPVRVTANVNNVTMDQLVPDTHPSSFYPVNAYTAIASDLIPGKTYYYKLGNSTNGYTSIRSFVALEPASSTKDFSFVVMPDTQASTETTYITYVRDLFSYIKRHEPDASFLVHLGDMVNTGYNTYEWQRFLNAAKPLAEKMPIMSIVGNHDGGRARDVYFAHYLSRFSYLTLAYKDMSPTTANTVYSFEYGNALFMVMNCTAYNNDIRAQWNFFLSKVTESSNKKWKILFIHIPPYSPGNYYNIDNEHGKLIADAGVDLVISGHEHSYFRTTLHTTGTENLRTDQLIRVSPETGAGTTYVIAGTANNGYRGVLNYSEDTSFNEVDYRIGEPASNVSGMYGKVTVTEDYIQYTEYDSNDGSVVDDFKITKNRQEFNDSHQGVLSRVGVSGMPYVGNPIKVLYTPSNAQVSYQWERSLDGVNWSKVTGASGSTYTPLNSDLNYYIRSTITGTGEIKGTLSSLPTKRVQNEL